MTDWTEHDGYTLRNALRNHPELGDCDLVDACTRAAGHIEALESRIATLEAERADTIPRAVLVSAMRERARTCGHPDYPEALPDGLTDLADEIERGEWPKPKEGT